MVEVILVRLSGHVLLVVAEAGIVVTAETAATADQDPLSAENAALFVKIDQSLPATEVQNPRIVLHLPRQGTIALL